MAVCSGSMRSRVGLLASAVLVFPVVAAIPVAAQAAPAARFSYTGSAYGTSVNVGSVVKSGPSAPVTLGCTADGGIHRSNTTAGIDLAPLASSGTVFTTADTQASPVRSATTATTEQVNLLGGLVHAAAVTAASATTRTATGFTLSAQGTTVTNLVVGGRVVTANAAPNTRIVIPGFGYLIVNEQHKQLSAASASLTVNALHLVVTTANTLGITPNSNVIVSHAMSGLSAPVAGVLDGTAYGTKANAGKLLVSGPTFQVFMPCLGTGGVLRVNTGAGVSIGTALATGTIRDTTRGSVTAAAAVGETTSTVQAANLLSGLLTATLIKADAHASTDGATFTFSDSGSTFGSLSVNGHPTIGADVAPNTKIALSGIGTLYLHRVIRTGSNIEVRMIELVLTNPVNGLAAGTDLRVAVAEASAH